MYYYIMYIYIIILPNMESPFVFGQIARGKSFINRTSELQHLVGNFASGTNTMVIAPRRWGKSSLVNRAGGMAGREDRKLKICSLDLFRVRDEAHFFEVFAQAVLKASSGRWQEWVSIAKELLKGLVSSVSIGTDPVNEFRLKLSWESASRDEKTILDLPEKIARKKKIRFIICIDEFQKITGFRDSLFLQQRLRSHWQDQSLTSYCLYGSKRHMITELFTSKSQPFYQFGDLIFLQKIEESYWERFMERQFKNTGKSIEKEVIGMIIQVAANHPYHVQQLAHYVWGHTGDRATPEIFRKSLDELLAHNEILFKREVEHLTALQLNYLEALVQGEKHLNSSETIRTYNLGSPGNLGTIKSALETKEIIDFYEMEPMFVNPLFEYWLKTRYFPYASGQFL